MGEGALPPGTFFIHRQKYKRLAGAPLSVIAQVKLCPWPLIGTAADQLVHPAGDRGGTKSFLEDLRRGGDPHPPPGGGTTGGAGSASLSITLGS